MSSDHHDPMKPVAPDHEGDPKPEREDLDALPVDPADPLKRGEADDQPGMDPTPALLPED